MLRYRERLHFESSLPRHYAFIKSLVEHGLADVTVTGTCVENGMAARLSLTSVSTTSTAIICAS